jgi:hypothetical protein
MLNEDDPNLGFMFSYIGHGEILDKVAHAKTIRECDLTHKEIAEFRPEVKPWIDAGMVYKTIGRNPNDFFEEVPYYSLTPKGEEYHRRFARNVRNSNPTHQ